MVKKKERIADDAIAPIEFESIEGMGDSLHVVNATYKEIHIDDIEANYYNPNEMDEKMFNMLVDNLTSAGMNQTILVTPKRDEQGNIIEDKYVLIDGEQRINGLRLTDATMIPCMIREEIDEDDMKFQTLRMNMLKGKNSKIKLQEMVQKLIEKGYSVPELADKMGFADEDAFRSIIEDVGKGLKGKVRKEFDKVKDEIQTIDDLTLVLNKLFAQYGSSLPFNYMIFDFGGKKHLWIRLGGTPEMRKMKKSFELCQENMVTVDSVIVKLLELGITQKFIDKYKDDLEAPSVEDDTPMNDDFMGALGELED